MGSAKMKLTPMTTEIQKPEFALNAGNVSTRMTPTPKRTPFVIEYIRAAICARVAVSRVIDNPFGSIFWCG